MISFFLKLCTYYPSLSCPVEHGREPHPECKGSGAEKLEPGEGGPDGGHGRGSALDAEQRGGEHEGGGAVDGGEEAELPPRQENLCENARRGVPRLRHAIISN
jgi:hypothetical protein